MLLEQWQKQGKYVELYGQSYFYSVAGEGEPLFLIHGFPTASWDWHLLWPELSKHFKVITMDMLGYGFSDKPKNFSYSVCHQANAIEALLQHLEIDSYYLLTHDFGNTVGQELLARQRDSVETQKICRMMMLNGGIFPESHRLLLIQKLLLSRYGHFVASKFKYEHMVRNFSRVCKQPLEEQQLKSLWHLITYNDGLGVMADLVKYIQERQKRRPRWSAALMYSTCPVQFVCGLDDPISGEHMLERYREIVPFADTIGLQNVGHYPQLEAPKQVLDAVLDYFSTPEVTSIINKPDYAVIAANEVPIQKLLL